MRSSRYSNIHIKQLSFLLCLSHMASNMSVEQQLLDKYSGDIAQITEVLRKLQHEIRDRKTKREYGDVVVNVQGVNKVYKVGRDKVEALKNVSLQVMQGEFLALTGTSGSGKSTLLQLIGGLDKATSGILTVNGDDISKLKDRKLAEFRGRTIGFVFQFFYLQPFLNLGRNLEVPGIFARTKPRLRQAKATELAEKVDLSDRIKHLPNELSGGQMQRAAIARALLNNPKIILADEPTGNLDRKNAFAIMDLLSSVRDTFGTTVIVVTHDAELAARADREVKLQDGEIV